MKKHIANIVTILGIFWAVWANLILWGDNPDYVFIFELTLLIAASDLLDGRLARRHGIVTGLGKSLDRFRDKMFCVPFFAFLLARWEGGEMIVVVKLAITLILIFEAGLVASWIYGVWTKKDVSSHSGGKAKQVLYMAAILLWLFFRVSVPEGEYSENANNVLVVIFFLAACFASISLGGYLNRYFSPPGEKAEA